MTVAAHRFSNDLRYRKAEHPDTPKDAKVCTPLSCAAWTFTARLTKQGPKPVRPDGRADLHALAAGRETQDE